MIRYLQFGFLVFTSFSLADAQLQPIARMSRVTAESTTCDLSCGTSGGMGTTTTDREETTSFDFFNESAGIGGAVASQQSSLDSNSISVASSVDAGLAGSEFGFDSAASVFQLEFRLTARSTFDLTGVLTEIDVVEAGIGYDKGGSTVSLTGNGENLMLASSFLGDVMLDEDGLLEAGTYELEVRSFGNASSIEPSADTSANVSISFIAVPEPSISLPLMLLAFVFAMTKPRRVSQND